MSDADLFFLKSSADAESKGPFSRASLRDSRRRNLVKDTALVQRDGETTWVPIKALFADEDQDKTRKAFVESKTATTELAPPGSVGLGFLAGFFGGCIGLGLVYAIAKGADTKRGAIFGFAAQAAVGVLLRVAAPNIQP